MTSRFDVYRSAEQRVLRDRNNSVARDRALLRTRNNTLTIEYLIDLNLRGSMGSAAVGHRQLRQIYRLDDKQLVRVAAREMFTRSD